MGYQCWLIGVVAWMSILASFMALSGITSEPTILSQEAAKAESLKKIERFEVTQRLSARSDLCPSGRADGAKSVGEPCQQRVEAKGDGIRSGSEAQQACFMVSRPTPGRSASE